MPVDESARPFSDEERDLARLLAQEGRRVEALPVRDGEPAPDAAIDGVETEFKTLRPGATASTLKNQLNEAKRQAAYVIIDARRSGLKVQQAKLGVRRFERTNSTRLVEARIIGSGFDLRWCLGESHA